MICPELSRGPHFRTSSSIHCRKSNIINNHLTKSVTWINELHLVTHFIWWEEYKYVVCKRQMEDGGNKNDQHKGWKVEILVMNSSIFIFYFFIYLHHLNIQQQHIDHMYKSEVIQGCQRREHVPRWSELHDNPIIIQHVRSTNAIAN